MSTPSPREVITLPTKKSFNIIISNFPDHHPGLMKFAQDPDPFNWTADYSVPSVQLAELKCPVTPKGKKVEFGFTVKNATEAQKQAGYIDGKYTFSFDPPDEGTTEFFGKVNTPQLDLVEDTFTAKGNEPELAC